MAWAWILQMLAADEDERLRNCTFCPNVVSVAEGSGVMGKITNMLKAKLTALLGAMMAAAGLLVVPPISAGAAELLGSPIRHHVAGAFQCGPCGCLHASYAYHRELRSTYGLNFDPRNFDQTQPYYFLGPVRAYPRYWCNAGW
jgi:hypothetical protein